MHQDEKVGQLGATPLFAHLHRKDLRRIAELTTEVIAEAGRVLCREGDLGGDFFVVESGSFRVDAHGRQVATLGPGDFFGELALLDGKRRTATVVATSTSRVLVISHAEFAALLREEPVVAVRMLPALAERMRRMSEAEQQVARV